MSRIVAAFALVPAACALHPTDWGGRLEALSLLLGTMEAAGSGEMRGASGEAAGWLCWVMMQGTSISDRSWA